MTEVEHKIRVAVLSDLHFCKARPAGSGSELSHIVIEKLFDKNNGKNPWSDLLTLVEDEGLQADFLLCAGDITTHAQHEPIKVAWNALVDLGKEMGATLLGCATGNHDVNSRLPKERGNGGGPIHQLDQEQDFFENLKLLKPEYPLHLYSQSFGSSARRQQRTQYFGNDFVIHEDDRCRLVIFNSCARHTNDEADYERGLIAESALEELKEQLNESATSGRINIFLCHHHPIVHSHNDGGQYDFIKRGDKLIQQLEENGDWIIIHGHKHDGRIKYAPSGGIAPVVFAASSLGAILSTDQLNKYRNQFYILNITLPSKGGSRGTLDVWNWHLGTGWSKSEDPKAGLVDGTGFGERRHPDDLADIVAPHVKLQAITWRELVTSCPFIKNLTPDGLLALLKSLKKHHGVEVERDPISGRLTQIGPGA